MVTLDYGLLQSQLFINYVFTDILLLKKALTAPGAEGDKEGSQDEQDKYEGNRKLASIGKPLYELIVREKILVEGALRSTCPPEIPPLSC